MARILYLTQVLPYPLDSGAKIRQYHMLGYLAQDHELTLVSFTRPDDPPEAVSHLEAMCDAVHTVAIQRSLWCNVRAGIKGLATGLPMVIVRDEMEEMVATLKRLTQESPYDVVHADQLSMAGYGRLAARFSNLRPPRTLLDEHNAIYLLTQRMAETEPNWLRRQVMRREARAFARYEAEMCRAYDALLTVIPEDRERLLKLLPAGEWEEVARKFTVIPICVDPAEVSPVIHSDGHPPTILHVGTMFWPPNINGVLWFAREVLPIIHKDIPDARFVIVGKNPPEEVQALASDPRVEVTGYVVDLDPYLAAADVFVVPLHAGSGMRVKILDAWLWSLPVISTPIGAEGIEVVEGENILLAGEPQVFARAAIRLLSDKGFNRELRTNGRAWVERHYSWQEVYKKVDLVYERLLNDDL